ncbi:hypothetical protein RhiirA1_455767 [Rhizophagus irregularis]|uniref:Uncharacterized protein n=1 Tax=Rhizophagus irregularis TaxID=588596 RepID=A0A2N0S242_9GLOM|nr:hypothetical protein RhiirA1_455767 [Rhizophagus irregularis]
MKEYLNNNIKRIKIAQNYNEITNILSYMEQYLLYFKEHWIGNIELGWTYYDKLIAANILNMTVDSIPNNYFEAFNNQLKTHQLDRFKNRRNLLRLDILSVTRQMIKNRQKKWRESHKLFANLYKLFTNSIG